MVTYFQLQYKRISRHLIDFGIHPLLALVLGLILFLLLSKTIFFKLEYAALIYPFIAVILIFQLSDKKRFDFLKQIFSSNVFKKIRLIENLIVITPFCFFLLYEQCFQHAAGLLLMAMVLSFIPMTLQSGLVLPTPFSKYPFEFTAGFRDFILLFVFAYFLATMGILVGNYNLGAFALMICYLTCLGFYAKPEPVFFVWIYKARATGFLKHKLLIAIGYSFLLGLPVLIALAICFPGNIIYTIGIALLGIAYVVLSLLGKYTNYPAEISLWPALGMTFSLFFPPLLLITIPVFYSKSKKNLYLYK